MSEMTAAETLRSRAEFALGQGSVEFAYHLSRIADKGEEAAQAEIDKTRAIGKRIVDRVMAEDIEGRAAQPIVEAGNALLSKTGNER